MRVVCSALIVASAAFAQPASTLDGLVAEALASHPEVIAAQKRYEAARQRPGRVSTLPDPMFSPGYAANGRPWPGAGLGVEPTSNIGFMVSQEFPYPGKRKLQGAMAEKEAGAEFQNYRQVCLNIAARLKQAWFRRAFTYKALDVIERNLAVLDRLRRITEVRYAVGRAAQQDIFKTQTQMALLQTRRVQLEREKAAREAEILSLLGRGREAALPPAEDLKPAATVAPLAELYASARDLSPMLRREENMIQRSELAVNMARKDYFPDYKVNAGYFNMGRMPDMYQLSVDVSIPIWFFRKQRAGVAEQAHTLAQSRKSYEAAGRSLDFQIKDEHLTAETSAQLAKLYLDGVIPQASLTLESSLASYETGAVDFLNVLMNYSTVVEYEMNYWEELQNYYLALSRLEEMTGKILVQ
jgi:outer membrane protein, heavy metal efflux system